MNGPPGNPGLPGEPGPVGKYEDRQCCCSVRLRFFIVKSVLCSEEEKWCSFTYHFILGMN